MLDNFEQCAEQHHENEMRRLKLERSCLHYAYYIALKAGAKAGVIASVLMACAVFAQPQPPPIPASAELRKLIQMRQVRDDYAVPGTVITVLVTQTVTTVYELDYLRFTRAKASPTNINLVTMKTNWLVLGTNPVSCITNSSPVNP